MPELPEVETVCRGLAENIINKKIASVQISDKKLRFDYPKHFSQNLPNNNIVKILRRARYILIYLDNNKILLIHLGMTGKLNFYPDGCKKIAKHDHIMIKFTDNSSLIYNDVRRFGFADLFAITNYDNHKMLKNLGVEPLTEQFHSHYLQEKLQNKKGNIKNIMMNNKIVVGVGNIYINEALFLSNISPLRPAQNLSLSEIEKLISNIKNILQKAINKGGSTLRDYQNLHGDVGNFQLDFNVYGRENQKCFTCSDAIVRIKQNGRSSFWCKSCQS